MPGRWENDLPTLVVGSKGGVNFVPLCGLTVCFELGNITPLEIVSLKPVRYLRSESGQVHFLLLRSGSEDFPMNDLVRRSIARWDVRGDVTDAVRIIWQALGTRLALAVFSVDLLFILLHLAAVNGLIGGDERLFQVDKDRNLSEWFEYAKLFASSVLVFRLSVNRKHYQLMPMALVIFYLCLDDALRLHEFMGEVLVPAHDNAGEVLFMMIVGGATVTVAAIGYVLSERLGRIQIISVLLPILLLGAFGTVIDALHEVMIRFVPTSDELMGLLEDGGELVSISVLLLTCAWLAGMSAPYPSEERIDPT
jgi:hypothetical protein